MTLSLNHQQRLNLIAVLGTQDIKGREAHAIWHLQDTLDLDSTEKEAIEFREQTVNGQPIKVWNMQKELPPRSFDLTAADLDRIRRAVEDFPQFKSFRDRVWLEPLLAQLPPSQNGSGT